MNHWLKTIQPYFSELEKGNKKFEIRKDDRGFNIGDEIYLEEFDPKTKTYSGKQLRATIKYILKNFDGIQNGYCILSLDITQRIFKKPRTLN